MKEEEKPSWEKVVEAESRADHWLHEHLTGYSRARVRELIAAGRVLVQGRRVKKGTRLHPGELVTVIGAKPTVVPLVNPAQELMLAYEDAEVLVVEKPAGMATHPLSPEESDTLVNAVLARYPEVRTAGGKPLEPGLLHRLDRKTQGLVMFARTPAAFAFLRHEFAMRRLKKVYRALVHGEVKRKNGEINLPLAHHPRDPGLMVAVQEGVRFRGQPQIALTRFRVLEKGQGHTLLELELVTGVMHQLRVHLAFLGHPVLGEDKYGDSPQPDSTAYALQATSLDFLHPRSREKIHVRVRSPLRFSEFSKWQGGNPKSINQQTPSGAETK